MYMLYPTVPNVTIFLTPNTTRLPNVAPYNTFSLTCTATTPEGVVSPKTFTWWRRNAVMNNTLVQINHSETNYINSSTLNQPVSTSVLTVTETTAGVWNYSCTVTLEQLTNVTNEADSHPIHVTGNSLNLISKSLMTLLININISAFIGPMSPEPPVDLLTDSVTTHSATVSWIVTTIAFTPETYVVHYGTSMDSLGNRSDPIMGLSNFTTMNYKFLITLTALTPNTVYFYYINSTNTLGSDVSQIANFTTEIEGRSLY